MIHVPQHALPHSCTKATLPLALACQTRPPPTAPAHICTRCMRRISLPSGSSASCMGKHRAVSMTCHLQHMPATGGRGASLAWRLIGNRLRWARPGVSMNGLDCGSSSLPCLYACHDDLQLLSQLLQLVLRMALQRRVHKWGTGSLQRAVRRELCVPTDAADEQSLSRPAVSGCTIR